MSASSRYHLNRRLFKLNYKKVESGLSSPRPVIFEHMVLQYITKSILKEDTMPNEIQITRGLSPLYMLDLE